jgi:hypothetical protein
MIGQGVFVRWMPENRKFALESEVVLNTVLSANALARDRTLCFTYYIPNMFTSEWHKTRPKAQELSFVAFKQADYLLSEGTLGYFCGFCLSHL